jgi:hypothetical protein
MNRTTITWSILHFFLVCGGSCTVALLAGGWTGDRGRRKKYPDGMAASRDFLFLLACQSGAATPTLALIRIASRQNERFWSMQINTNNSGFQIDVDPANPAYDLTGLFGHVGQVMRNGITRTDTSPGALRKALSGRGIDSWGLCTCGS